MVENVNEITQLRVAEIFADPTFNCRGSIPPVDVVELAKDIETHGLQQPIVVKPIENGRYNYKIISGHRRHKAFEVLDWPMIPCVINENISDANALILNLGENLHRKDLNIMQEAHALKRLKMSGFSINEVASELNKSTTWVSVRYMLLELPEEICEAAAAGFVTQKHIKEIHALGERGKQLEATKKIKQAKFRGEKVPTIHRKKRNMFKPKAREREDVFFMQDHIQHAIGNNFGTRCLAWAAGEISDLELFRDIEEIAIKAEIQYTIPYSLGGFK
jgi:ParB family chromosome partitioning protein